MPFEATWMDLDIVLLSEVRQRKISCDTAYMWNLKKNKGTNELIYKTEIEVQMQKANLWIWGGGIGRLGLTYAHYYIWTEEPGRLQSMASQRAGHS